MTLFAEADDGALIAYDVHGGDNASVERPPVLLVHGFASEVEQTWAATGWIRAFERAERAVIALDLRGHGRSDRPTVAERYTPVVQAGDLRAVLDAAGAESVDIIAYSMGTRVTSAFAGLDRDRLRRVVLGGTGPIERFSTWDDAEVERVLAGGDPPENRVMRATLRRALGLTDPSSILACVRGMRSAALEKPGDAPVLFVAGDDDDVTEGAEALAGEWGAGFVGIPGRNHISSLTSRVFKDAALGFLD